VKILEQNKKNMNEIITALNNGAVLVLPTDTVYGLVCDAKNKKAVEKIYKIKKRPRSKPLPVFVRDFKMAKELAEIDKEQERILNKKWPGKYTFILKSKCQNPNVKSNPKSKTYGINKETIALRIPRYKFLNDLLKKVDKPLAQTSVNISGQPSLNNIKEIIKIFSSQRNQPDLIIDAGNLPKNKPSVIIDLTNSKIKILRK